MSWSVKPILYQDSKIRLFKKQAVVKIEVFYEILEEVFGVVRFVKLHL